MEKWVEDTLDLFRLSEGTQELRKVFVQGTLWQLIIRHSKRWRPVSKKRSEITRFTYQARVRLMKFINTIDYEKTRNSLFMTFTYPDWPNPPTRDERNVHRAMLVRAIEGIKKKPLSGIWRIEWKPRLTGNHVGLMMPHWHYLLFNVGWINYKKIRTAWRKILHLDFEPSMKFVRCQDGSKVTGYVSKYVAKVDGFSNLDNVAYLNNHGRHYGMLRKAEIPRCEPRWYPSLTETQVDMLWMALCEYFDWQDPSKPQSLGVMGKRSLTARVMMEEMGLTPSAFVVR